MKTVTRLRLLVSIFAALVAAVATSPVVDADGYTYGVATIVRVGFQDVGPSEACPTRFSDWRAGSASPPAAVQGTSTTPTTGSVATNNGGGVLPPPSVSDSKLQNLVNNLWKGTANSSPVGNGTTADAVRYERATGQPVGGKFHTIKAQETVNGLTNWLKNNPNASYSDRLVAQSLIDDLLGALNCVP